MEILDEKFELVDLYDLSFKIVPRGFFVSENGTRLALDYHAGLLNLAKGDHVRMCIYKKKPEIPKNVYLTRGMVYKIEEDKFECSFGGLLLLYDGKLSEGLGEDEEIYLSVAKI